MSECICVHQQGELQVSLISKMFSAKSHLATEHHTFPKVCFGFLEVEKINLKSLVYCENYWL